MTVLYILLALVGISIIIFLHELGHFMAAKRVGVRVERFSVGFDPPIRGHNLRFLSFKRGETEYVIGMVPFGGYVKLAGETELDPEKTGSDDELMSKSVGARALVFVAGAAMNIISAFFFFIVAFSIGVDFTKAEIGVVHGGRPAWEAGIRPGDEVVAINGRPVSEFLDLMVAVALGKGSTPIELTVARAGGAAPTLTEKKTVTVIPQWDSNSGFNSIGVEPALSTVLHSVDEDSKAYEAGLRPGDAVTGLRIDGVEMPAPSNTQLVHLIFDLRLLRPSQTFEIAVENGGKTRWVQVVPQVSKESPRAQLGVIPGGNIVRDVRGDSEAADVLSPGDEVLRVGNAPVAAIHWLPLEKALREGAAADGSVEVLLRDTQQAGATPRPVRVDSRALLRWHLSGDIRWDAQLTEVPDDASPSILAAASLERGDVIVRVGDAPCYAPSDLVEAASEDKRGEADIVVKRGGGIVKLAVPWEALRQLKGLQWQSVPAIAAVIRDGPADRAGFTAGSTLLEIDDQRLRSWPQLIESIQGFEPGAETTFSWRTAAGETATSSVTLSLRPSEPLLAFGPEQTTVKAGILESVALGASKTVTVSKWVFLTLRSLFRREVSAKNLQGPVGIAHVLTKVSEQGFARLVYFLAIISVNLGLFNLLPFPILDGGHLMFLLIEKIKGSPVDIRIQEWATNIAFLLIISLAVFVTFNDVSRLLN